MKALIFSDLQADEGAERRRSDPSTPLQRWRVQQFYRWAAQLVRARHVDAVWDLGDTTNNRTSLAHPTVQTVTRGCAELTAGLSPLHNFKLLGNHEQHLKAQHTHVGGLFTPYFHVVENRAVIRLDHANLDVVCVSFSPDTEELSVWLTATLARLAAQSNRRQIVLGHFTVAGARFNSGVSGSGVPVAAFAAADLVLLGHVHRRQSLGANGYYVGSPFQQDFGEAHDPIKGVAILDTDTLALEWVPSNFPVYRTVTVDELPRAARSDDIIRVTVRNSAEAQRLYASPLAGTVEPVYAFTGESPALESPAAPEAQDFDSLTRAYVHATALPGVAPEDLLAAVQGLQ